MKRRSPLCLVLLFIALIPFAVCGTNPSPAPPQKPAPPQNNDDSDATGLCCAECKDNTPNCLNTVHNSDSPQKNLLRFDADVGNYPMNQFESRKWKNPNLFRPFENSGLTNLFQW